MRRLVEYSRRRGSWPMCLGTTGCTSSRRHVAPDPRCWQALHLRIGALPERRCWDRGMANRKAAPSRHRNKTEHRKPEAAAEPASKRFALKDFVTSLGPGLITGASDDDPSGIGTYSQAG